MHVYVTVQGKRPYSLGIYLFALSDWCFCLLSDVRIFKMKVGNNWNMSIAHVKLLYPLDKHAKKAGVAIQAAMNFSFCS